MADIFDFNIRNLILHEDDGSDIINGGGDNGGDQAADSDAGGGDNDNGDAEESGGDDEFNIDTSVDDEGGDDSGDDEGGDDSSSDDSMDDSGGDMGGGMDAGEGEPLPENNDVFVTLTAEEQQVKIMELKKLYNDLYTYADDLLKKMNDLDVEEDTLEVVSRTSSQLYQLKIYLRDYMTHTFNTKSFIENDVYFNRFSSIIYSIGNIVDRLVVKRREKLGIEVDDE